MIKIPNRFIRGVFSLMLLGTGVAFAADQSLNAAELKPRLVVLTDIGPGNVEPDDQESMVRLLVYADRFEIEGLIAGSGWNNSGRAYPVAWLDILKATVDAYEKDLPNLMKRSGQTGFQSVDAESKQQELGYWPSPAYLRSRAMLGSLKLGFKQLGETNHSAGSDFLIRLADEDDARPIWIATWGGANTFAQAVWRVQKERTPEQFKAFLRKFRVFTITDQDKDWGAKVPFEISSHQWLRREFERDLMFIWDESAWLYQCDAGKKNWSRYETEIQGRGNLGRIYPKYKYGVEGDTPSFLYVMPNGLNTPEQPGFGGWGGFFARGLGADKTTSAYVNQPGAAANSISRKYETYFYPAIFNDFAARMNWAERGAGNRNPVVVINGLASLSSVIVAAAPGSSVTLDASATSDPDGDKLAFKWWILPEAGSFQGSVTLANTNSNRITVSVPSDAAGKSFHVVCEVKDNGTPNLTSYRRVIFDTNGIGGKSVEAVPTPGSKLPPMTDRVITAADVTVERVGTSIPASAIGEPVGGVTLSAPRWFEATENSVAYALVDGSIAPKDPNAKPIQFRVLLPANWSGRAIQMGGGGFNGVVPMMRGEHPGSSTATFARYGSDSGHSMMGPTDWALNDEVIRNFGFMQMKKTHDAVMVIMERVYGGRPRFNYYVGNSQGGREAMTVAQRYPADYDGIVATVPVLGLSSLMLAPEWIRIQEKPLSNWVTRAKANAIRAEFMRQADKLDGLADGVINNYMAARALFDMSQGDPKRNPWAALRAPDGVDPNPADASANARLTDGQIETLKLVYSRYKFASPLANGARSFGMWVPNTDPAGSGLIADRRFRGQEGAGENAPMHGHLGVLGVTGFLMQNLSANPLDYVEGGPLEARRKQLSEWLDSTKPDLSEFYRRGGKMIVTIGTDDTLASPGAQLDYYQSVLDKIGREKVDAFARFYVLPQTGHGLSGRSCGVNGDGKVVPQFEIPNGLDRIGLITAWVERNQPPGKTVVVTAGGRSMPLCSYPNYPRYKGGPIESAESYESAAP